MNLLQRIKKNNWYQKGFEGSGYALYQWQSLLVHQHKQKFPTKFHELLTITHGNRTEWFYNADDLQQVRKWMVDNVSKKENFASSIVSKWQKQLTKWTKFEKTLHEIDFEALTDKELVQTYKNIFVAYEPAAAIAFLNEGFSLQAEKWLGDIFTDFLKKKNLQKDFSEHFSWLTRTTRPSFIQEAAIAKRSSKTPTAIAKKFYWMHFNYLYTEPLRPAFFAKWKPEPLPDFPAIARKKQFLIKKLRLSLKLKRLFAAVDLFTWWQDQRKKNALILTFWMHKFLEEAGRRAKIPKNLLLRSIPPEFEKIVNPAPKFIHELKQRRNPIVIYIDSRLKPLVFGGKEAAKCLDAILHKDTKNEVRGSATYLGKVSGRVLRLLGVGDMKRMRKGNILVTSMTRPEYTPILRMAAGIVTDEGGITSHAAIISREFKIPCVIGTKIATKILKDGDMVEVDAEKGVVRKI